MAAEIASFQQHRVARTLAALRDAGSGGMSLEDLLTATETDGLKVLGHSGAASVAAFYHGLLTMRLVSIESPDKVVESGFAALGDDLRRLRYDAVEILRSVDARDITVRLTQTAVKLQELLGFSISALAAQPRGHPVITTTPMFSWPSYEPSFRNEVVVLMPFRRTMRAVYETAIKQACVQAGLSCKRADDFFNSNEVMQDIWSCIFHAKWVVADCTGRNANVFYELGIAHMLGKPTILITQNPADVPFDLRRLRILRYSPYFGGLGRLRSYLTEALAS